MSALLEVPRLADLDDISVDVAQSDEAGVVSVTTEANDGSVVSLTWDELAGSINIRWVEAGEERLMVERETASKVSISKANGQIEFRIWFDASGLGGQLVVRVGERVVVSDTLLRK